MGAIVVTPPALEPVGLWEAKDHLRITHGDEDEQIAAWITAAREYCEGFQRRAYVTQTLERALDCFPANGEIELPQPPLQRVESITYTDRDGGEATFAAENYLVDTRSLFGRVVLRHGKTWPAVTLQPVNGVIIRYVAGYGAPDAVPQRVKQAMLLLIGHWYENREAVQQATGRGEPMPIPFGVDSLLNHGRLHRGAK